MYTIQPENNSFSLKPVLAALKDHDEVALGDTGYTAKSSQAEKTIGTKITAANKVLRGEDPKVFTPRANSGSSGSRGKRGKVTVQVYDEDRVYISHVDNTRKIVFNARDRSITGDIDFVQIMAGTLRVIANDITKLATFTELDEQGAPVAAGWVYEGHPEYTSTKESDEDARKDIAMKLVNAGKFDLVANIELTKTGESRLEEWIENHLPEPETEQPAA